MKFWKQPVYRNRIDLLTGVLAFSGLIFLSFVAADSPVPGWEVSSFRAINNLPDWIYFIVWPFMQYGVFVTIPAVAAIAIYFKKYRLAALLLIGGIGIYFLALVVKNSVERGRPGDLLVGANLREKFRANSLGFPAGHTAVASTIATFAHRYLSKRWQILSIFTLAVVLVGRIYIGAHLPLDVIGGVLLGVSVASFINFVAGSPEGSKKSRKEALTDFASKAAVFFTRRARHPGDAVRLVLGSIFFVIFSALAFGGEVGRLEEYAIRFINSIPDFLTVPMDIVTQFGALFFVPAAAAFMIYKRRYVLATKITAGGIGVWLLAKIAKSFINRDRPLYIFSGIIDRAHASGILGFPSGHAAVASLLATVISPYVSKNWSRALWTAAWAVAIARVYTGAHLPLDVLAGLCLGWVSGAVLNLVLGTPVHALPRAKVMEVLSQAGLKIRNIKRARVDARGSYPIYIETKGNKKLFGKFIDSEHRNADVLFKIWRYFTLREVEDEAPFATAKHLIEHEAYLYSQALSSGVKTPKVLLAAPITHNSALLVTEMIPGVSLDAYGKEIKPVILKRIWREVAKLHKQRIAHRDLRAANVLIGEQGQIWLIDFSFAETAASDQRLNIDLVEMLVSLSLYANPELVVRAAIDTLGKDAIKATLPFIQPAALTSVTRRSIKKNPVVIEKLRSEVQAQSNATNVKTVRIARFSNKTLFWFVFSALVLYFGFTQLDEGSQYLRTLNNSNPYWMAVVLLNSIVTYVMAAIALLGASVRPLAFTKTLVLEFATSFVNRITPKSFGGIAITERFLENNGLTRRSALSAVSVLYIAGILTHAFLLMMAMVLFAAEPISIDMPEGWALLLFLIFTASVVALYFIPRIKRVIRQYAREGLKNIKHVFSTPLKTIQLFAGSFGVTFFYSLALYCSLRGFDVSIAFSQVFLVYLAGSVVASASPTPGGLGATEAALAGGFIAVGVDTAQAVTSVLAFRLFTYWLPIIPGVIAFRHLEKNHLL